MENNQKAPDEIVESWAARLAYYFAFVPLFGYLFFMLFGFLGLVQIGRGQLGLRRLSKGLVVTIVFSILPLAGLIFWAELPVDYYIILNAHTKHGCYITNVDGQGKALRKEYFRFGKLFRDERFVYYKNGNLYSEEYYVDDDCKKLVYWYETGNPRIMESLANGRRHGLTSWFDENGKLERSKNFVNGLSQEQVDAAKKAGLEPVIDVVLGENIKMRLVYIPPGEFIMGTTDDEIAKVNKESNSDWYKDEAPQHKVTIKHGFYLCETEITQEVWEAIMGYNFSRIKNAKYPVVDVSWDTVQQCIMQLNTQGKGTFRLPTEAEWEYSARAGTTTSFGFGNEYGDLSDYAWTTQNSVSPNPVANKKPNDFGLFDMHGNVWEWVEDDYHENYKQAPVDGRAWIDSPRRDSRVLRGGSWLNSPRACRSSFRLGNFQTKEDSKNGVRFAMTPKIP